MHIRNVFIDLKAQKIFKKEQRRLNIEREKRAQKLFENLYRNDSNRNFGETQKKKFQTIDYAYFKSNERTKDSKILQLLTEREFQEMMTQRENFELWKKVSHMTSIFRKRKSPLKIYRMKFDVRVYKEHTQYKKAKKYIQNLADNYKKEDVLEDLLYIRELIQMSSTEYCIYQVCKMVWFFEIFRKRSINKMMVDFSRTSERDYWILDIQNIQHSKARPENLERFFIKKIGYREPNYLEEQLPEVKNFALEQDEISEAVARKVKMLDSMYEKMKSEINLKLTMKEKVDTKPDRSFKVMHPFFNVSLTEIVEGKTDTKKVIKNLKKMYYVDYKKKGPVKRFGIEREELFRGKINEFFGKNLKKDKESNLKKRVERVQAKLRNMKEAEKKKIDNFVNRYSKNYRNKDRNLPPLKDLMYDDPFTQSNLRKAVSMKNFKRQPKSHKILSKTLLNKYWDDLK